RRERNDNRDRPRRKYLRVCTFRVRRKCGSSSCPLQKATARKLHSDLLSPEYLSGLTRHLRAHRGGELFGIDFLPGALVFSGEIAAARTPKHVRVLDAGRHG